MKSSPVFVRALLALVCSIALAACGGSNGTVKIGGTVTGLTTSGLSLTDGLTALAVPANATTFVFPTEVTTNYSYSVAVLTQPTNFSCTVTNGYGVAGTTAINDVAIACAQTSFKLGGTVTGLKAGNTVTLVNGNQSVVVTGDANGASTVSFAFSNYVLEGATYGLTILKQPAGQTCTIPVGLGTMPATGGDVLSLQVSCI